ncbi:aldo-keto reductase family 1 member B1-like [Calliphora vicina]|uniref:aldo-keto reductase family 1 member B1-like n=1 Tax=Calliphora vicina TaxID=7373 RepID=UPI00325B8237
MQSCDNFAVVYGIVQLQYGRVFAPFRNRGSTTTHQRPSSTRTCIENPKIPTKTLSSGHKIPVIGLGTWGILKDEVKFAVTTAIYRLIDSAFVYQNEKFVGQAIKQMLQEKVVKRCDIFITTKLWNTYHQPDLVSQAIRLSLNVLQLSYLDLYLMHWPTAYQEGKILLPRDTQGHTKFSDIDYVETWKAMEELQDLGLTKTIGISNFNRAVLQCECHPFLNQKRLMEFCRCRDIVFMAYSPWGSSETRPYAVKGEERLLESKEIVDMDDSYHKTPAQILIRYQIQRGNIVIPKSIQKSRIESNLNAFNWELTFGDMNKNLRYVNKIQ